MSVWLYAALLVVWGNLLHPLLGSSAILPGGSWAFLAAGVALVAVSLLVARILRLERPSLGLLQGPLPHQGPLPLGPLPLGLRSAGAQKGGAIGAVAGGIVAVAAVVGMRVLAPAIIGQPIVYEPLARVSSADLTGHIAFFLPLGTVIPEELAFRGTLLGGLLARSTVPTAVAVSSIAFALWHVSVVFFTMMNTTMPGVLVLPAIGGAFIVLLAGGAVMAGLRLMTGTLVTSIAAHWVFNAVILVGLRYPRIA
jgi:membrane protease YdiL (CAAX protease family)